MPRPELSLIIPIYNEEEVLPQLADRLRDLLVTLDRETAGIEVVFVNDGSRDESFAMLKKMAEAEPRYRVIGFARNFGHQRAITAGMDMARGEAVVVMDADLQDPPEVIVEMVAKWREGFDVVYGRRRSREGETWFKLVTAKLFYRMFAAMIPIEVPLDTGDFRLMSRRVVLTLRSLRETHRFVRGMVSWVGFKQIAVEYDRAARAAGTTKYPFKKMLAFAFDGIASFSILPLRLATYVGLLVGLGSVIYAIAAVITHMVGLTVPGWTTTVVLVSFLFSVQLLLTGVLGEYVGRIYEQVKARPLYVVAERVNFKLPLSRKPRKPRVSRAPSTARSELAAPGVHSDSGVGTDAGAAAGVVKPFADPAFSNIPTLIGAPSVPPPGTPEPSPLATSMGDASPKPGDKTDR